MQTQRKKGKYMRKPGRSRKNYTWLIGLLLLTLVVGSALMLLSMTPNSIYDKLSKDGYSGSQEQWLASLVGETVDHEAESAYVIAQRLGYRETHQRWSETITGIADPSKPAYHIMLDNGYEEDLVHWLTSISENPEELGRSSGGEAKTEYELACEYGYSGNFIQWIVSMADKPIA